MQETLLAAQATIVMKRPLQLAFLLWAICTCALAEEPAIWAKHATVLNVGSEDLPCAAGKTPLYAPDSKTAVQVLCRRRNESAVYSVQVRSSNGVVYRADLDEGAHELLWAPDSKAFFVNGGLTSYSGFFVTIYRFGPEHGLTKDAITVAAQHDMVISFPPCRAWNRNGDDECRGIASDPQYNMSGLRWTTDSSAIDVFAEVPCSSNYGGIMCQVKGYELQVADGHIVRSYSARGIPSEWRRAMAWKMHIPSAARYGHANATYPYSSLTNKPR